jgi:hypothetical protein
VNALCRDCGALETAPHQSERCASCGSPTLFERELNGPRRLEHAIDAIRGRLGGGGPIWAHAPQHRDGG